MRTMKKAARSVPRNNPGRCTMAIRNDYGIRGVNIS
jgi:hypothetical protein